MTFQQSLDNMIEKNFPGLEESASQSVFIFLGCLINKNRLEKTVQISPMTASSIQIRIEEVNSMISDLIQKYTHVKMNLMTQTMEFQHIFGKFKDDFMANPNQCLGEFYNVHAIKNRAIKLTILKYSISGITTWSSYPCSNSYVIVLIKFSTSCTFVRIM